MFPRASVSGLRFAVAMAVALGTMVAVAEPTRVEGGGGAAGATQSGAGRMFDAGVGRARAGDASVSLGPADAGRASVSDDATAAGPTDAGPAPDADADAADADTADADADAADAALDADSSDGAAGAGATDAGATLGPADAAVPPPIDVFPESPAPRQEVPKAERPELLLRTILALLAVLAFAYIGGQRRIRQIEEALGIRSLITSGFPFVALGLIAKHPAVGAVSDYGFLALGPLIEFGLGWLGFLVGLRFDLRAADKLPARLGAIIGLETGLPFVMATVACGIAMGLLGDGDIAAAAPRFGVLLGIAAAMSTPQGSKQSAESRPAHALARHLDQVVGVLGLALVAVYSRPRRLELSWELPGTVWLFLAVGMGATLGVLASVLLRRKITEAESIAIVLGSVAFAGGMAAYIALPPIVICFVAGLMLANVPGSRREELRQTLGLLERPIYLVFLFVAGAMWDPGDWRGWVLLVVFVASRSSGLLLATRVAGPVGQHPSTDARTLSAFAPLSIVSIAVVVSAQSLYRSPALPWMMTAVIGGAMASEVLAQIARRRRAAVLRSGPP